MQDWTHGLSVSTNPTTEKQFTLISCDLCIFHNYVKQSTPYLGEAHA